MKPRLRLPRARRGVWHGKNYKGKPGVEERRQVRRDEPVGQWVLRVGQALEPLTDRPEEMGERLQEDPEDFRMLRLRVCRNCRWAAAMASTSR